MKLSAKEARLIRLYDLTQVARDIMEDEQDSKCKICGKVPENGLYVDHSHKVEKWKIKLKRNTRTGVSIAWLWEAYVESTKFWALGGTKKEARNTVRRQLKRASIRGLLCYPCNTALGKLVRKGRENPTWLRSAAKYLEDFDAKIHNPG